MARTKEQLANEYFFSNGQNIEIFIPNSNEAVRPDILALRGSTGKFISYADNDMAIVEFAGRRLALGIRYIIAQ